jgi:hypothetical protein
VDLAPDLAGEVHRPLVLTDAARLRVAARGPRIAATGPASRELISLESKVEGIPHDVLVILAGLALLADRGNELAKVLLKREEVRLGIDQRKTFA